MKRTFISLLIMVLGTLSFVSCGDDDELTESPKVSVPQIKELIKDDTFYFNLNSSLNKTDKSIELEASLNVHGDFERWGYVISNVSYYLDDVIIGSTSQKPFALSTKVENLKDCKHYLIAQITISGNNTNYVYKHKELIGSTDPADAPKVDIYVNYNQVATDDLFTISAYINRSTSEPDLKITKATLYWNGNKVGDSTIPPYSISKKVTENSGDSIDIEYHVEYTCGKETGINIHTFRIGVVGKVGGIRAISSFILCSKNRKYKNGDYIMGACNSYFQYSDNHQASREMFVYLDDTEICHTDIFPYIFEYKLEDLSVGPHYFSFKIEYVIDGVEKSSMIRLNKDPIYIEE